MLSLTGVALCSRLPEIDWTVERLDRMAANQEPGMVRLRSPRTRSPQLARLVKPASGGSGPPIRVRPSVRPPSGSPFRLPVLAMPAGRKVPLRFDTPVEGSRERLEICPESLAFPSSRPMVTRAPAAWTPGMALRGLVGLRLEPAAGLLLTEGIQPELSVEPITALGARRAAFVHGTEFDPPLGGMVPLTWKFEARRGGQPAIAPPPPRPVVSYRWVPIKPELEVRTDTDWALGTRTMAQLTLNPPVCGLGVAMASPDSEPVAVEIRPSFENFGMPASKAGERPAAPPVTSRMLPLSLDKCTPKAGKSTPVSKLDHIAPKPAHQFHKSTLKTQADWQRNKWTSASVYGSALWRIAIGRFSGALGQAPKAVRWVAGVMSLGLAAFALLPGDGPSAPRDTAWTVASNPGTPVEDASGTGAVPSPRRVKVTAPPPRVVNVKATKPVRVPPAGTATGPTEGLGSAWDNIQRRLGERAAVAYTDDFRNGLAEWEGSGEWARSWSYDASGFVRTGALALLAPARDLTDYRMEFLGQIERRSMGWVVRAADLRNYYALKLTIVADGPVPEVALIRYPVINGVAGAASQQSLPIDVRSDTVYRVQTEVRDSYYAVTVQGKVVDSWTDNRLKRGSIGLFSGKGELARVRWIGVWHQYDTLGRLCALLAPSGLPGKERGANQ